MDVVKNSHIYRIQISKRSPVELKYELPNQNFNHRKPLTMKPGQSAIHRQTYVLPTLRFENQQLLTLSMASNEATENDMLQILDVTPRAA